MNYPFQTFTALEYLQIDIASNYGLDKKEWVDRLLWFELNQDNLEDLFTSAEEPALFYAGVQAYYKAIQGEVNTYPISLDAVASGMQILSALTGDRSAAKLCNVIDTGTRQDAYTLVYQYMLMKLGGEAQIIRDDAKKAVMCSLYGSEKEPERVFGTGEELRVFYETMEEQAPAAWELNKAFLEMWNPEAYKYSWVLPDNFHVEIKVMGHRTEKVTFLGQTYDVQIKDNLPAEKGRSLGANAVHSLDALIVREIVRRCGYDPVKVDKIRYLLNQQAIGSYEWSNNGDLLKQLLLRYEQSGYLSSRVLECINKNTVCLLSESQRAAVLELIDSLPPKPFQVLTIHDAFRVLPNYANDLRYQYNLQLTLIARSNMLSYLLAQILDVDHIDIQKYDPDLWKEIMSTNYALS